MPKTIFIVDDSASMLLTLSSILTNGGYAVEQAASAEDALVKFNAGVDVDVLITDFNMPGMNGVGLIHAVRKLPPYRFLPIFLLSTESDPGKKADAKAAGATGWIAKPPTTEGLLKTIRLVIPDNA